MQEKYIGLDSAQIIKGNREMVLKNKMVIDLTQKMKGSNSNHHIFCDYPTTKSAERDPTP